MKKENNLEHLNLSKRTCLLDNFVSIKHLEDEPIPF
jgi:hypothetical protein